MDKSTLKNTISGLSVGQVVRVNFSDDNSGDYRVTGIRKGRGRGGSMLLDLADDIGQSKTVGTPNNADVRSITVVR